jgi:hypothetical protein
MKSKNILLYVEKKEKRDGRENEPDKRNTH